MSLTLVPTRGIGTLAVDKYFRLYYDSAVLDRWTLVEAAGVLGRHETDHLRRLHPTRTEKLLRTLGIHELTEPLRRLINLSQDAEVNFRLAQEGITLPDNGGVTPESLGLAHLAGQPWEVLFAALLEREQQEQQEQDQDQDQDQDGKGNEEDQDGKGQDGKGKGEDRGQDQDSEEEQEGEEGEGEGEGEHGHEHVQTGHGDCGSCADGQERPWELGPPTEASPGLSESQQEVVWRRVAERISASPNRSSIPGDWQALAEDVLRPRTDWRRVMRSEVVRAINVVAGQTEYTYRRPSRKPYQGVVRPGLVRPEVRVVVVRDTSGSMGAGKDSPLERASAEVLGIIQGCGLLEVPMLDVDARACGTRKVRSAKDVRDSSGHGGTDMGVGIKAASDMKPRPDVCIVLTDGYTPWPAIAPRGLRVIVGLVMDGSQQYCPVPAWARKIECWDQK